MAERKPVKQKSITNQRTLYPSERRSAWTLAGIFGLRMLGLFMIYPIFALSAKQYAGASSETIGIALGIYGLTQALLQIPFGMASDRFGRKPLITLGLALFVVGSAMAAMAHSIDGLIVGRAVQGGGAVGAVILALAADLTRAEQRTKAIGIIGMSIGLSFVIALVTGPLINAWVGLSGLFWLTAIMGGVAIIVLWVLVPNVGHVRPHRDAGTNPGLLSGVLKSGQLVRLDLSIFMQHAILAALFLALPVLLRPEIGQGAALGWRFYLPVLAVALVLMVPFVVYAETRHHLKGVLIGSVFLIGLSLAALVFIPRTVWLSGASLVVFFSAFTLLEAVLPSLVSKVAPIAVKGTAMGTYSTAQFLGIFVGAAIAGWIEARSGSSSVILFTVGMAGLWLTILFGLHKPPHYSSRVVKLPDNANLSRLDERLLAIPGVIEAQIAVDEQAVYLKLDRGKLNESELLGAIGSPAMQTG